MKNTSIGFHTFSVYRKLKYDEHKALCKDFARYIKYNKNFKGYQDENARGMVWEYTYNENKGIRWRLSCKTEANGFVNRTIEAIINPQALYHGEYITAATSSDLNFTEEIFNEEAEKISPILMTLQDYSLNRVDYCLNIDLDELGYDCTPQQLMKLIRQGDIPASYKEWTEYSKTAHRYVSDKNCFYLVSDSVNVNFYIKYAQQNESHPNFENKEASKNVIRLEVQCKSAKLNEIQEQMNDYLPFWAIDERIELNNYPLFSKMLSDHIAFKILLKYLDKIVRKGHYFTFDGACEIIEMYGFKSSKENRMIDALRFVRDCGGIYEAKKILNETNDSNSIYLFNKALRELDEILISPITIPRRWNIAYLPNIIRLYNRVNGVDKALTENDSFAERQISRVIFQHYA